MATIRKLSEKHVEGGFESTHVLDNGKFLSHVRLAVLDERAWQGRLTNLGVQIGRCRKQNRRFYSGGGCGKAWAWKRGKATLDEMRCPDCGGPLSQTTLALRQPFYVVDPMVVRVIATDTLHKQRDGQYRALEATKSDTEHSAEWREMRVAYIEAAIEKLTARLKKVQRNPKRTAKAAA